MKDDMRYPRATGSLTAMCRFLIEDLQKATEIIEPLLADGVNDYMTRQFKSTIKHGKEVLARVADSMEDEEEQVEADNWDEPTRDEIADTENAVLDKAERKAHV